VCQMFTNGAMMTLRGAVLKMITRDGVTRRVIDSEQEYKAVLHDTFGLELAAHELYVKVWQRHLDWLASGGIVK
jgi:arylamine N-acetyltransferase